MDLENEVVGIRRRLSHLRTAVRSVNDPLATTLIKAVITDMEARIATLEKATQPSPGARLRPAGGPQKKGKPRCS
jgi:hypothetical protein